MKSLFLKEISAFFGSLTGYLVLVLFLVALGLIVWVFPESSVLDYGIARTRMYGDPSHPGLCLLHLLVGRPSGQLGLGGLLWELARASDDWSHFCRRGLVCEFIDIPTSGGLCPRGISLLPLVFWIDSISRHGAWKLGLLGGGTQFELPLRKP